MHPLYSCSGEGSYQFQAKKTRAIMLFAENNSIALLNKFKKEVLENVSAFRLMPEMGEAFVPFEWVSVLASKCASEGLGIIAGIEHMKADKFVYNHSVIILPYKHFEIIPTAVVLFQPKAHYAPAEIKAIRDCRLKPAKVPNGWKRKIYCWKDCYFPVYNCFEFTDITARSEFKSLADMLVAVEYNRDVNYFNSIVESLTRDMHCYCVQVNTSNYGDSRIAQPTSRVIQNILSVKGGLNETILVGEVDFHRLRESQDTSGSSKASKAPFSFKPIPPGFNLDIVKAKRNGRFG